MRTKIVAAFLAGGFLVGAGFATTLISSPEIAQAQEEPEQLDEDRRFPRLFGILDEVLSDLVGDGTLTEEQAEAVTTAAAAKAEELFEQHQSLRGHLREAHPRHWRPSAHGFGLGTLLDDGGIDLDEYQALPEDHPLRQFDLDEYLEDGVITPEEFRHILPDLVELRNEDN